MSATAGGWAIETRGLTYWFGHGPPVLDRLSLRVPRGSIYGFLGPNGAGKSTALKLVLGLLTPRRGEVHLLGQRLVPGGLELRRQVGASIEHPSLYAHLGARENLRIWQLVHGCPAGRIDAVLELVGLARTGPKPAGAFSLGMKQRLALAAALLHQPRLLVLDEPTNGLDPQGIIELRGLLVRLNREEGLTVVVSSHLLAEVERLATHLGVIHQGVLRFQGPVTDFLARARPRTRLAALDAEATAATLRAQGLAVSVEGDAIFLEGLGAADRAALNRRLLEAGHRVHELSGSRDDLETRFLELLQEEAPR